MRKTIEQLKTMRETEDHVEFKKGEQGNVSYNGGNKVNPSDRRKCILGYVTALCNEKGGSLVIGMHDSYPHNVTGTKQSEDGIGALESKIYNDTGIRTDIYELYEGDKRVLVIDVPSRPRGRVFKFEDVPLMRVGEELKPMLTLNTIRQTKNRQTLDKKIVAKLLKAGYIEQRGRTSGTYYILGKDYNELSGKMSEYFTLTDWDENQVLSIVASFLKKNKTAKMGDFANLFVGHLSRKQIRSYIEKLVENGMLAYTGEGKMRTYSLSKRYESEITLITKAVEIGLNEISKQVKDQKKDQ